jgi:hypothetical protein
MKLINIFLVKSLPYYVKRQDFFQIFNCAFNGLDMEPEPGPEPLLVKSRN